MVREYGCADEALEDTERSQTEAGAEHWEEAVEETGRPPDFRQNENNDLEDDEEAVDDGPEDACGLVGYCAVPMSEMSVALRGV